MATRSFIGMLHPDNTATYIYCHWDGYPRHNGFILYNNYNTASKVKELIDLGSLSVLRENVGEKHDPNQHVGSVSIGRKNKWCEVYYRDHSMNVNTTDAYTEQASGPEIRHSLNKKDLIKHAMECCAEWIYLFDVSRGCWIANNCSSKYRPLREVLEEEGLIDPLDSLLDAAKSKRLESPHYREP